MLPPSHITYTWSALGLVQKLFPRLRDIDYRGVALASILPDVIDKPLAVFVFPDSQAGLLYAHTGLLHLITLLVALIRKREWLPYALAGVGHLLLDRIWFFPRTFFYPLLGRRFHQWRDIGTPKDFGRAYAHLLQERPRLVLYELFGLGLLAWFVWSARLYRPTNLKRFLRTGKI